MSCPLFQVSHGSKSANRSPSCQSHSIPLVLRISDIPHKIVDCDLKRAQNSIRDLQNKKEALQDELKKGNIMSNPNRDRDTKELRKRIRMIQSDIVDVEVVIEEDLNTLQRKGKWVKIPGS